MTSPRPSIFFPYRGSPPVKAVGLGVGSPPANTGGPGGRQLPANAGVLCGGKPPVKTNERTNEQTNERTNERVNERTGTTTEGGSGGRGDAAYLIFLETFCRSGNSPKSILKSTLKSTLNRLWPKLQIRFFRGAQGCGRMGDSFRGEGSMFVFHSVGGDGRGYILAQGHWGKKGPSG